jgi:hypothetical protein
MLPLWIQTSFLRNRTLCGLFSLVQEEAPSQICSSSLKSLPVRAEPPSASW